jgi:PAP2 superfamily
MLKQLPPWGVMEEYLQGQMRNSDRVIPPAWRLPDGSKPNAGQLEHWRAGLIAELAGLLWPTFDPTTLEWSATPNERLIQVDFELLNVLKDKLDRPIGEGTYYTHRMLFKEEDNESKGFGLNYERYDAALPAYLRDSLPNILLNGFDRKLGSLHYQLKQAFQRPRAYQVAAIRGWEYSGMWAKTGGTPSFISGHCLEGAIAGCSAFALFGMTVDSVSVDILQQFCVDIGDRRVFAGVHYPSDNLGSWITALHLLPYVFDASVEQEVRAFLWGAIDSKSMVFAAIKDHIARDESSPYVPAVSRLRELGTR